jgi:hypothetical protein
VGAALCGRRTLAGWQRLCLAERFEQRDTCCHSNVERP